jgi:DNA-binding NarL/FixJ family response regulator
VKRLKAAAANYIVSDREYTEIAEEFRRLAKESQYFDSKNIGNMTTPGPRLSAMDDGRSGYYKTELTHLITVRGALQAMVDGLNSYETAFKARQAQLQAAYDEKSKGLYLPATTTATAGATTPSSRVWGSKILPTPTVRTVLPAGRPAPVPQAPKPASPELESDRRFSDLFADYGIFVKRLKAAAANYIVSDREYTEIAEEFRRLAKESQYFDSKNIGNMTTPGPRLSAMDDGRSGYYKTELTHLITVRGALQAMVDGLNSYETAFKARQAQLQAAYDEKSKGLYRPARRSDSGSWS